MKACVITFPGSNCDRDAKVALESVGAHVSMVWHQEKTLPKCDLVVLPGGFSYGDYLRCGAIAGNSPIISEVKAHAKRGGFVIGICNGFQILTETGLLPGVLMRNRNLKFICSDVYVRPENTETVFTKNFKQVKAAKIPIAHMEGNYYADQDTLASLEDNEQIAFRYCDEAGKVDETSNPNGAIHNIAGILSKEKNVLGMMPHPERASDPALGLSAGRKLFEGLVA